jgi:5'-methylthioadenosine phosphorylase
MSEAEIGVIGGSGLHAIAHESRSEEVVLSTPWGPPSGALRVGTVAGRRVAFLARHGEGHVLLPSEINYRANVWAMRMLGVTRIVSASAVGSLREEMRPRDFVVVDQFVDRTTRRASTYFGDGLVAHVSMAHPTCAELRGLAELAGREAGLVVHGRGTYVCIEGPQFGTLAESRLYRSWGGHVVGMTNATEARLAREAEICYASLAMVTDYDCWNEAEEHVSVEMLLGHLRSNAEAALRTLALLLGRIPAERTCPCARALDTALITDPARVPSATRDRLELLLAGRLARP